MLMILLENGCSISKEENVKYCNFLLEIKADANSEQELKSKAGEKFTSLGCIMEEACNYCYIKLPDGPPPPGPPPSGLPPCENTRPASCPLKTKQLQQQHEEITIQQTNGSDQQSQRKKRFVEQVDPLTKVAFDTDASFLRMMMEIPPEYR